MIRFQDEYQYQTENATQQNYQASFMQLNEEEKLELANLDAKYTYCRAKQAERISAKFNEANSIEEGIAKAISSFSALSTQYVATSKQAGIKGRNKHYADLHLLIDLVIKKDPILYSRLR